MFKRESLIEFKSLAVRHQKASELFSCQLSLKTLSFQKSASPKVDILQFFRISCYFSKFAFTEPHGRPLIQRAAKYSPLNIHVLNKPSVKFFAELARTVCNSFQCVDVVYPKRIMQLSSVEQNSKITPALVR